MTQLPSCAAWILGASLAGVAACGSDTRACTLELRTAVLVELSSPEGLPIDRVSAEHERERDCSPESAPSEQPATFACHEAGGGTYTVRVHSGQLVWTRAVEVDEDGNGCHVAYPPQTLSLTITADSAD